MSKEWRAEIESDLTSRGIGGGRGRLGWIFGIRTTILRLTQRNRRRFLIFGHFAEKERESSKLGWEFGREGSVDDSEGDDDVLRRLEGVIVQTWMLSIIYNCKWSTAICYVTRVIWPVFFFFISINFWAKILHTHPRAKGNRVPVRAASRPQASSFFSQKAIKYENESNINLHGWRWKNSSLTSNSKMWF